MKVKLKGVDKFMIAMLLIYFIAYFINSDYIKNAFSDFLSTFVNILPILLFVFIFMFLINYFLKDSTIKKHLGKESGLKGWFYVVLSGFIIPSPPYIVIPLLSDLEEKGMRKALIVTFLYARNLQIAFLPVLAYYFGVLFVAIYIFYVFIFAILSGILLEKIL
jgi:uncharacterized membrane protein YraQ (UPF0718 family)